MAYTKALLSIVGTHIEALLNELKETGYLKDKEVKELMTKEEAMEKVADLVPLLGECPKELTGWEYNFIQDTSIKLQTEGVMLSENEDSKIEEIWEKFKEYF